MTAGNLSAGGGGGREKERERGRWDMLTSTQAYLTLVYLEGRTEAKEGGLPGL